VRVIRRRFEAKNRAEVLKLVPLGDIHCGSAACDEKLLKEVVKSIAADKDTYWLSMGDVANFINLNDPRFSVAELAPWIKTKHLGDVAKAELDHYLEIVAPIAHKCLAMVCGNHELMMQKHYERDVYAESVASMKLLGKMAPETQLAIGYTGLLQLQWRQNGGCGRTINISLHHGFGGASSGASATRMQKWLWQNECDVAIFGHVHSTSVQKEAIKTISLNGIPKIMTRFGCYSGTFLDTGFVGGDSYSEIKGYAPLPLGGVCINIRPYQVKQISITAN
jgi:predicted phosphodiesterase